MEEMVNGDNLLRCFALEGKQRTGRGVMREISQDSFGQIAHSRWVLIHFEQASSILFSDSYDQRTETG